MKDLSMYHGHSIDLDLKQLASDCFRWTYFIDANYCMQGVLARPDRNAARDGALALARRSIETLEPMVTALQGGGLPPPHRRDRETTNEALAQDAAHGVARTGGRASTVPV